MVNFAFYWQILQVVIAQGLHNTKYVFPDTNTFVSMDISFTTAVTCFFVVESKGSTLRIPEPPIGHDPQPILCTSLTHNLPL